MICKSNPCVKLEDDECFPLIIFCQNLFSVKGWELILAGIYLVPVSSRMNPLLAKAQVTSSVSGVSMIKYLRMTKKTLSRSSENVKNLKNVGERTLKRTRSGKKEGRRCYTHQNSRDSHAICEKAGVIAGHSPAACGEDHNQSRYTQPEQIYTLQSMEWRSLHCSKRINSLQEATFHRWEGVSYLSGVVTCWGPVQEHFVPEGLHSMETYWRQFWNCSIWVGNQEITQLRKESILIGGIPSWRREEAWRCGVPDKLLWTNHSLHSPSTCTAQREELEKPWIKLRLGRNREEGNS